MKRVHDSANTIALARHRKEVFFLALSCARYARGRFRPRTSRSSYTAGSTSAASAGSAAGSVAVPSFG